LFENAGCFASVVNMPLNVISDMTYIVLRGRKLNLILLLLVIASVLLRPSFSRDMQQARS